MTLGLPVAVSHPTKVFWPDEGYTKLDLAEFYARVFSSLEPYVKDRLLTLERCPDGMIGECFYERQFPEGMPPGTPRKRIRHVDGGYTEYVVGGSLETQIALVNLGCIAVHVMAGRASAPRQPDWLCIDIDPTSGTFGEAAHAGLLVRDALEILGLNSFPKTSGSRGMHVLVPLRTGPDADEVMAFAESFVGRVAAAHPTTLTVEHAIPARDGRVYLDPFRNGFMQSVAAPYSVRRRARAPVSTPLAWSEVKATLVPSGFNLGNFAQRLQRTDPWSDFFQSRQGLGDASRRLQRL
jgi:bifunctional non-homologous end joining protein LigD